MDAKHFQSTTKSAALSGIVIAWTVVLLISDLPDAMWQALAGAIPAWLFWAKVGGLSVIILLAWAWKRPDPLRPFCVLLVISIAGRKALNCLGMTPNFVQSGGQAGLLLRMMQFEGSRLLLAAIMVAALLVMGKRRRDFLLSRGDLKKWMRPGIILALSIMILTFLFFDYDLPSAAALIKALPLISAALFIGALAAFDEEMRYRASLLSYLYDVVGKNHSIMITAFFFGMSHYFGGVPSGAEGFFIAGGLGWLYATMMLETKGVFMSWLNHFLTNVPTFIFWAIGSILN